jgi:3'(2'),5'-bisphosphate nucleotidase
MQDQSLSQLVAGILDLAIEAGKAIMAVYSRPAKVSLKQDATPITEADLASENIILKRLASLAPEVPVISEESAATGFIPPLGTRFLLVDPLDGTKEFLSRNGEFTVNIAMVENSVPVWGVIFAPALPRLFWGERDKGAFEASLTSDSLLQNPMHRRLQACPVPRNGLRVLSSRSHGSPRTDEWLKSHDVAELVHVGSSLKFCLIAAAEADVYPRFGRTMEWDTAAGDAILRAAGGKVVAEDGSPLIYGKKSCHFANPSFIASGP